MSTDLKPNLHYEERICKCQRAFYSLQCTCIGMCRNGSSTCVKSKTHVWNTALIYGCQCVNFNATSFQNLKKTQGKLVKSAMGLHKYCKTTPLLHGLNLCKINDVLSTFQLNLVCQIFNNTSKARSFYAHLLNCEASDDLLILRTH